MKRTTSSTAVAQEGRVPAGTSVALHVRIDFELNQLLMAYLADREPAVSKTAVVAAALRRYLVAKREDGS